MKQLQTVHGRFMAHLEAWFIDHEVLRIFYRNFHKIGMNAYRSNHPSAKFIKKLKKKHHIKTIINLRGANNTGQYKLEKEACEKYDITLVDVPFSSREAPTKENIKKLFNLFDTVEYPILMHCKSGADRAGIGSTLFRFYKEGIPMDQTDQLKFWYGHIKQSETGILDKFVDIWTGFHQKNPDIPFSEWLENTYDSDKLNKEHHASRLGNLIVNKILRRE